MLNYNEGKKLNKKQTNFPHLLADMTIGLHLQGQAVVSRSLVFAAVVLPVIHVNMVQLQEAHKISGRLQIETHTLTMTWCIDAWLT